MAEDTLPAPAPVSLGQVAYEAECTWLNEVIPGPHTPWDALDPEVREVYQRLAGAAAGAERERIRQLALEHGAVYCRHGACTCIRLGSSPTIASFASLIREPQERSEEKGPDRG